MASTQRGLAIFQVAFWAFWAVPVAFLVIRHGLRGKGQWLHIAVPLMLLCAIRIAIGALIISSTMENMQRAEIMEAGALAFVMLTLTGLLERANYPRPDGYRYFAIIPLHIATVLALVLTIWGSRGVYVGHFYDIDLDWSTGQTLMTVGAFVFLVLLLTVFTMTLLTLHNIVEPIYHIERRAANCLLICAPFALLRILYLVFFVFQGLDSVYYARTDYPQSLWVYFGIVLLMECLVAVLATLTGLTAPKRPNRPPRTREMESRGRRVLQDQPR